MPESNMNSAEEDLNLIMTMMRSIKPGDMSEEAANELMMIGQRIQNGGRLSDQERDAITQVMRAMPAKVIDPSSAVRDAELQNMGAGAMTGAIDSGSAVTDAEKRIAQEEAFQRMIMEQNEMQQRAMDQRMMDDINSGSLAPMTSPRPRARPMR